MKRKNEGNILLMKHLTPFWLFLLLFLSGGSAFATHAIGGEISYRCLGNNQYEITYVFYRDCGALAAPSMMSLNVTNSCGYTNPFTFLTPVSTKKINFTCTPNLSDCNSGGYFGVERWVYRGTITLNGPCDDWTFSHTESSRSQLITTLQANSNLYVYARVDNTQGCFDSPVFREPNLPVSCLYNSYCADNLVDKTNNDLIIYNLITPLIAPATNATYSSLSYSATQPISTDVPPVFDSLTGTICFQPNTVEFGAYAVIANQYQNGILVGQIERDMMIDVKSCNDAMPLLSGFNGSNTQTSTGCAGTNVCFSVFSTDTNQTDSTFISADSLSPFSITHRGGVKDSIDICWNTQSFDVMGSPYFFRFTVRDNHCPETATTSQVFRIDLNDSTSTFCRQLTTIEDEKELQFSISPNPADGLFHLNFPFGTKRMIQIYDLTGKKSFEYISLHDEKNIDVTLSTGIYFVKVTDSVSGKTVTKRIVSMK